MTRVELALKGAMVPPPPVPPSATAVGTPDPEEWRSTVWTSTSANSASYSVISSDGIATVQYPLS